MISFFRVYPTLSQPSSRDQDTRVSLDEDNVGRNYLNSAYSLWAPHISSYTTDKAYTIVLQVIFKSIEMELSHIFRVTIKQSIPR